MIVPARQIQNVLKYTPAGTTSGGFLSEDSFDRAAWQLDTTDTKTSLGAHHGAFPAHVTSDTFSPWKAPWRAPSEVLGAS